MRLAIGLFGVLAALVAILVAAARLPLTAAEVSASAEGSTLAVLAVNYHAVGFCALASVFAALVMVSDDWISIVGFTLSALLAALLSSLPVAIPLLLAIAALIWFVALPQRAEAEEEPAPARPQRLRPDTIPSMPYAPVDEGPELEGTRAARHFRPS